MKVSNNDQNYSKLNKMLDEALKSVTVKSKIMNLDILEDKPILTSTYDRKSPNNYTNKIKVTKSPEFNKILAELKEDIQVSHKMWNEELSSDEKTFTHEKYREKFQCNNDIDYEGVFDKKYVYNKDKSVDYDRDLDLLENKINVLELNLNSSNKKSTRDNKSLHLDELSNNRNSEHKRNIKSLSDLKTNIKNKQEAFSFNYNNKIEKFDDDFNEKIKFKHKFYDDDVNENKFDCKYSNDMIRTNYIDTIPKSKYIDTIPNNKYIDTIPNIKYQPTNYEYNESKDINVKNYDKLFDKTNLSEMKRDILNINKNIINNTHKRSKSPSLNPDLKFVKTEIKTIKKENFNLTNEIKNQSLKIKEYENEFINLSKIKKQFSEINETVKKQEDVISSQLRLINHLKNENEKMNYKVSLFRDDDKQHVNTVKNQLSQRDKDYGVYNNSQLNKKYYKIGNGTPKSNLKLNLKYNYSSKFLLNDHQKSVSFAKLYKSIDTKKTANRDVSRSRSKSVDTKKSVSKRFKRENHINNNVSKKKLEDYDIDDYKQDVLNMTKKYNKLILKTQNKIIKGRSK